MRCVVTAGPTFEPLDQVRRLTNLSTGRLGIELAGFLTGAGHDVSLLVGQQATWCGPRQASRVRVFGSTADLNLQLQALRETRVEAVFHAAAVSDFRVGTVWEHAPDGEMVEVHAGKISSRTPRLLVELVPAPKIISFLHEWFPSAVLVGWKYEVDGTRAAALAKGEGQLADCHTHACVVNGPAYGRGFGLVTAPARCSHFTEPQALYAALEQFGRATAGRARTSASSVEPRRQ